MSSIPSRLQTKLKSASLISGGNQMGGEASIQTLPFNLVGPNAPRQYSRREYEAIQAQAYPNVMPSYDEWREQIEKQIPTQKLLIETDEERFLKTANASKL